MKKKNSVSEFSDQRNRTLLQNFRKALAEQSRASMTKAFKLAADAPAPRFWVSDTRAAVVIAKMIAGENPTESMNPEKKEMYEELFRRFLELRKVRPDESIGSLVFEVVNQAAPRSYISPKRAQSIIYKAKILKRQENEQ